MGSYPRLEPHHTVEETCNQGVLTPTASITPGGGEGPYPPPVRGDPSRQESPMESRRGEKSGARTMLGPARTGLLATAGPHSGALSLELPGAERSGERHTDEASATSVP